MADPLVYAVLINWNNAADNRRCLRRLRDVAYPRLRAVLVDNASPDASGPGLRVEFPEADFLQNDRNLGFAGGCNPGIRHALSRGADYVLLLNSDVDFEDDLVREGVSCGESDERIGVVGGKVYSGKDRGVLISAGYSEDSPWRRFVKSGAGCRPIGEMERDGGQYDAPRDVGFVSGTAMLVKSRVFSSVPGLPEEYFFRFEDFDFCLRARERGYRVVYCPGMRVWHSSRNPARKREPKYVYNQIRGRLLFKRRNMSPSAYRLWIALYTAGVALRSFVCLGPVGDDRKRTCRLFRMALRDHRKKNLIRESDLEAVESALGRA